MLEVVCLMKTPNVLHVKMKASKAAEIFAELQSFLFYNETTFAQCQNIRRHIKATGNMLSVLLQRGATVCLKLRLLTYNASTEASHKLYTVKLHIHNLSIATAVVYSLIASFTAMWSTGMSHRFDRDSESDVVFLNRRTK